MYASSFSFAWSFVVAQAIKSLKWWNAVGIIFQFLLHPRKNFSERIFQLVYQWKRSIKDHVRIHFSFAIKPQIRSREGTEEGWKKVVSSSINHLFRLLVRIYNGLMLPLAAAGGMLLRDENKLCEPGKVYIRSSPAAISHPTSKRMRAEKKESTNETIRSSP